MGKVLECLVERYVLLTVKHGVLEALVVALEGLIARRHAGGAVAERPVRRALDVAVIEPVLVKVIPEHSLRRVARCCCHVLRQGRVLAVKAFWSRMMASSRTRGTAWCPYSTQ